MTYRLPTASKLALAQRCAWPWSGGEPWPAELPASRADSRLGSALHEVAETAARWDDTPLMPAILEGIAERHGLTPAETDELDVLGGHVVERLRRDPSEGLVDRITEAPMAWDPVADTGRFLGGLDGDTRPLGAGARARDYSAARPGELVGTLDFAMLVDPGDGEAVVRDWKTGPQPNTPPAASNPQLALLALAVSRAHGVDVVRVELAHVDADGVHVDAATLDAFDLDERAAELRALVATITAGPTPPRPGWWCAGMRCPAQAICPATLAALAQVERELGAPISAPIQSPEHAATIRHRLPVLRAYLDQREEDLKAYALRNGPLPIEGKPGTVWGPRQHAGAESIRATPEAVAAVREALGEAGAAKAVEHEISKASIERGVRAALAAEGGTPPRGELGRRQERTLERLRAVGAVRRGPTHTRWEEFRREE